jgi:predicted ArsR family transcriptional regulator
MNLLQKIWSNIRKNSRANKLTRRQQIFQELSRGEGTARQLSDRLGLRLTLVRTYLSTLHKEDLVKSTGEKVGKEQVWRIKE